MYKRSKVFFVVYNEKYSEHCKKQEGIEYTIAFTSSPTVSAKTMYGNRKRLKMSTPYKLLSLFSLVKSKAPSVVWLQEKIVNA